MKKSFLALGVLGAFAGAAHAQNSVTLYGVVDAGLDYTNSVKTASGGASQFAMSSGDVQGSRWGLKGKEDLGGGLSTLFQIENGFSFNNGKLGQGGLMFGRQAFVGLASNQFGTVTLGRQYDSLVDDLAPLTANGNWGGGMFSHPYDNDNTDNSFRLNNAIKYTSVDYSGFSFTGAYAFSNSTNFANNRAESVAAQYVHGGLTAAAAYLYVDKPGSATNLTAGAVTGSDASWTADYQQVFGAGLNYAIGSAVLGFVYTHTNLENPLGSAYLPGGTLGAPAALGKATKVTFDNFEFNGQYYLTPALMLGGMYTYTAAKFDGTVNSGKPKYHTFGLMADYNVSKRTDVYIQSSYIHVASSGSVAGTGLEFASNPDNAPSATSNQVMARVGLRHKF